MPSPRVPRQCAGACRAGLSADGRQTSSTLAESGHGPKAPVLKHGLETQLSTVLSADAVLHRKCALQLSCARRAAWGSLRDGSVCALRGQRCRLRACAPDVKLKAAPLEHSGAAATMLCFRHRDARSSSGTPRRPSAAAVASSWHGRAPRVGHRCRTVLACCWGECTWWRRIRDTVHETVSPRER